MPHFTKRLETEDRSFNFYFNRIYTVSGLRYHVSVTKGKLSHYFIMQDAGAGWEFTNADLLPQWIIEFRTKLSEAITQHLEEAPEH